MKTTIDIPDDLIEQSKIMAARRRTTFKKLVIEGLETILKEQEPLTPPGEALSRLRTGYHLKGRPLTREEIHAR